MCFDKGLYCNNLEEERRNKKEEKERKKKKMAEAISNRNVGYDISFHFLREYIYLF